MMARMLELAERRAAASEQQLERMAELVAEQAARSERSEKHAQEQLRLTNQNLARTLERVAEGERVRQQLTEERCRTSTCATR